MLKKLTSNSGPLTPRRKSKKIILMTATGQGNLGDELILTQEIRLLQEHMRPKKIRVFSHHRGNTRAFLQAHGVDMSNVQFREYTPNHIRKYPLKNLKNLVFMWWSFFTSSTVIIGGGGLLYDTSSEGGSGRSPLRLWQSRARLARLFRCRLIFWSIGVSTSDDVSGVFHGAIVTVRDSASQKILAEQGIDASCIADPVFSYTPRPSRIVPHTPHEVIPDDHRKTVGLALRRKGLEEAFVSDLREFLESEGYEVVGMPHSMHPDDVYLDDESFMDVAGVGCVQSFDEVISMYWEVDYMITNRLHAMILSVIHHIPVLPVVVNEKTNQMALDLELAHALNGKNKDITTLWNQFVADDELQGSLKRYHDYISAKTVADFEQYLLPYLGDFS